MAYSKYSMNFDGVDDYMTFPMNGTSTGQFGSGSAKEFTISFWINMANVTTNKTALSWGSTPTDGAPLVMIFPQGGGFRYYMGSFHWGAGTISTDTWYHFALTRTASDNTWRMYVNGVIDGGATYDDGGTVPNEANGTNIYLAEGAYNNVEGNIDEVAIFDSVVSAATLYNGGAPNDISGLNPVAYYKMGEGAIFPQIPNEMAYSKQSMNFDGAADYVTMGDVLDQDNADAFSISAWINLSSASSHKIIVSKMSSSSSYNYRGWNLAINSSMKIFFGLRGASSSSEITAVGNTTLSTGVWYHIGATYDGSSLNSGVEVYLNGSLDTPTQSGSISGSMSTTGITGLNIGSRDTTSLPFPGNIDEVAIFSSELTSGNITTIYNNGAPNDISALSPVGWWKLGDGDYFPTMTDSGSGGNDGTATNMTGAEIKLDTPNGWGTSTNMLATDIEGVTANGNGGTMTNMGQADIVQDAPT